MSDIGPEGTGQLATTGEGNGGDGELPEKQEAALDLLRMGITVAETARTTGVSRGTIYHWLRHDPVFQAAYNRWHDEMEKGAQSRLLMMTEKAMDALEKALEAGDARAALHLLKGMGMFRPREVGPTDPEQVRQTMEIEREKQKIALKRDRGKLFMENLGAEAGL
ncbi:MAG: helix-turn-helix domain-containing protein [Tepidisphaeraceae bacterium]